MRAAQGLGRNPETVATWQSRNDHDTSTLEIKDLWRIPYSAKNGIASLPPCLGRSLLGLFFPHRTAQTIGQWQRAGEAEPGWEWGPPSWRVGPTPSFAGMSLHDGVFVEQV